MDLDMKLEQQAMTWTLSIVQKVITSWNAPKDAPVTAAPAGDASATLSCKY
jgi:hypothetical protein|uniref:Uncharacterized protein n=1 Tax=Picea glauca TaxID=3330 RepID=A0A124GNV4_PICGL|nr:hypothetical protein ABT39_MTgene3229 [Picea glauca]QHR89273.1 hypothetical protein Q903MT_gene3294 [Picea sitchensis]